jgi:two-component system response regulator (stage 0 sporulation protein F)
MIGLKKILVVDDEAGIRSLLFDLLSGEGFKVTLASDGQESLEQMENDRFDLLITDINMPRLNGIEMLKRMKTAGRQEKVIVMTGKPNQLQEGVVDIPEVFSKLKKPFGVAHFMKVVTSALGSFEAL